MKRIKAIIEIIYEVPDDLSGRPLFESAVDFQMKFRNNKMVRSLEILKE